MKLEPIPTKVTSEQRRAILRVILDLNSRLPRKIRYTNDGATVRLKGSFPVQLASRLDMEELPQPVRYSSVVGGRYIEDAWVWYCPDFVPVVRVGRDGRFHRLWVNVRGTNE
jgi:hypothetical protein